MAKRRPRNETRKLILEEAHQMVREQGMPEAIGFRLNDALASLNLTTGAAYNIWESQDDFRVDLALHIARSNDWVTPELMGSIDQWAESLDFRSAIETLSQEYFDYLIARPELYLALYFWTVRDLSDEMAAAVREGYDALHEALESMYGAVIDHYGYEVVKPYTRTSLGVAVAAALEGAALRHRFNTEAMRKTEGPLFVEFVATLIETTTSPRVEKAA